MNDQAKFERLLKLMAGLSSNYGQNITQLKSLLGVTERTAYRYLKTIKDAGFIIENKNGCFRIDRKSPLDKFFRNLVHFSAEEAALLSRALHLIDDGSKFKHDLYDKVYALFDYDKVVNAIFKKEKSEQVLGLKKAILAKEQVVLKEYRSSNGGLITDRKVEPYGFSEDYNYLWAVDCKDKKPKIFKLSRINAIENIGEKQLLSVKPIRFETDIFRIHGKRKHTVSLLLDLMAYNLLIEEFPLAEGYIKQLKGNKYRLKAPINDFTGVGRFVLGLPDLITIEEPIEFKNYIGEKLKKIKLIDGSCQ